MKSLTSILFVLYFSSRICYSQTDTIKKQYSYRICSEFKKDCKPGNVLKNERRGIADTTIVFISGKIVEMNGYEIPFATIKLTNTNTHQIFSVATDLDGNYSFRAEAGSYSLKVSNFGYTPFLIDPLILVTGEIREITINLGEYCCEKTKDITRDTPLQDRDYKDTSVTSKNVYVINRNGTEAKEKPDSTSETIAEYPFGELLQVFRVYGDWLGIKRLHYVGSPLIYVKKEETGDDLQIPLNNEDLNQVYTENSDETPIYDNIEVTLITKEKFYQMKKTSINYFVRDTQFIKAKNGVIELKTGSKIKKYTTDSRVGYEYLGQFKSLNAYLIVGAYYEAEDYSYFLVDKSSGKETYSFPAFPYFSNSRKFVMCLSANLYRNFGDLSVYSISKDSISVYALGQFKNWMPADTEDQFWGNDNCFYVPVIPSFAYWQSFDPSKKNIAPDYNFRYVRINVKGLIVNSQK